MSSNNQNPGNSLGFVNSQRNLPETIVLEGHESLELNNLKPVINDGAQQDVKIEIAPKVQSEILPWIMKAERSDGIKEFKISNCTSTSFILNFFESPDIDEELMDLKSILSVKFQFNGSFDDLEASETAELSRKCNHKAVLIQLVSKSDGKISIFWKSKEVQQLLKIKKIDNIELDQSKHFHERVAEFLLESLKNEQLGLISTYALKPDTTEIEVNSLADSRDYNLLLRACEKGDVQIVKTARALGMNTTLQGTNITAQSLAMQNGHYDVILVLVEANLTFPKRFDIKKCPDEFRAVYKTTEMLHEHIRNNETEMVKEILLENPRKCYFYNIHNESAIKVALLHESMETYELLLSQKLRFGPHEDSDELLQGLSDENKRAARDIHNRHTQDSPMKHINVLLANSFICHDVEDAEEKMKYVNRAYRALNANIFIQMLLMIVAASKKFKIIFDFNRDCVSGADPTVDANTQGLFYLSGRIYVGAKQLLNEATEHETLATMAHELCHYVMNLVFKNDAKPYASNDNKTMQDFDEVSEKCHKLLGAEEVVNLVYECYPPESYHPELIVRVVHLLALYRNQPEKLKEVSETYSDLFEFYENQIHPKLEEALPQIAEKAEKENEEKDDLIFKYKFFLIVGGIFCLILFIAGFFVVRAVFDKPTYKFGELSSDDKLRVREAPINYKNVELRFVDLFPENAPAYDDLTSVFIEQMLDRKPLDLGHSQLEYLNKYVSHDWKGLAGKLKKKVLGSNFNFQSEVLKLEFLHEKMPDVFGLLTSDQIVDVLDGEKLVVGRMTLNQSDFYMERKFKDEDILIYIKFSIQNETSDFEVFSNAKRANRIAHSNELTNVTSNKFVFELLRLESSNIVNSIKELQLSFEEIFEKSKEQKLFVLSSEAGTGKTTSFQQFALKIKQKFPTRLVSYIDLKEFTKFYNKSGILEKPEELLGTILRSGSENKFEDEVIKEYLKTEDVVMFWDGFDEISPDYNKFIVNVLSYLDKNTTVTQFVSTRPLYSNQLSNQFDIWPYTFIPLSEDGQTEFLKQALISKNVAVEDVPNYIEKIENIFSSFEIEFDIPGILVMFPKVISNYPKLFDDGNLYQIYESFVKIKIDEWQETELGLKFIKSISYKNKFTLHEVFLRYSLNFLSLILVKFPKLKIVQQKIPKLLTNEEISRSGILYINGQSSEFLHGTMKDFFVAQYFVNFIYNDDDYELVPVEYEIFINLMKIFLTLNDGNKGFFIFLKSYLETQPSDEILNSGLAEFLRENHKKILFGLFGEESFQAFRLMFRVFSKDRDLLIDLLHVNDDETLYTALFNPVYYAGSGNPQVEYLKVRKLVKKFLHDEVELERFINGKNQRGIILFNEFYWNKVKDLNFSHDNYFLDEEIRESKNLSLFFDNVVDNLTEPENDVLFLSPTSSVYSYAIELLQNDDSDYEVIENYLIENGKYKDFLLNMIEFTMKNLQFSSDSNSQFKLPEKAIKAIESEIYDLFLTKGLMNFVPIEQNFEFFWKFLKKFTTKIQRKKILRQKTSGMCNAYYIPLENCTGTPPFSPFHSIFFQQEFEENHFGIKLYEKYFNKTELQLMIFESNEFLIYMAYNKLGDSLLDCLKYLKKIFDGNEDTFRKFLTSKIKSINMSIIDYFKNFDVLNLNLLYIKNFLVELGLYKGDEIMFLTAVVGKIE